MYGYYRTQLWLLSAATPPERSTRENAWVETAFQSERSGTMENNVSHRASARRNRSLTPLTSRSPSDFSSQSRGDGIEFARDRDGPTLGCNALAYADALYNLAYYLARKEADGEDLVQETYGRAIQAADRFTPGTNLCAVGSWGGRRPRLGGYVTRMGPTDGATAAGGHGPQGNPVQFPDSHSFPTSIPIEFPRIDVSGRTLGTS